MLSIHLSPLITRTANAFNILIYGHFHVHVRGTHWSTDASSYLAPKSSTPTFCRRSSALSLYSPVILGAAPPGWPACSIAYFFLMAFWRRLRSFSRSSRDRATGAGADDEEEVTLFDDDEAARVRPGSQELHVSVPSCTWQVSSVEPICKKEKKKKRNK